MVILRGWLVQNSISAGILALKIGYFLLSCKSINFLLKKIRETVIYEVVEKGAVLGNCRKVTLTTKVAKVYTKDTKKFSFPARFQFTFRELSVFKFFLPKRGLSV